jgi:hypothetical protein
LCALKIVLIFAFEKPEAIRKQLIMKSGVVLWPHRLAGSIRDHWPQWPELLARFACGLHRLLKQHLEQMPSNPAHHLQMGCLELLAFADWEHEL